MYVLIYVSPDHHIAVFFDVINSLKRRSMNINYQQLNNIFYRCTYNNFVFKINLNIVDWNWNTAIITILRM